jgi:probable HAF family extracellular repeat protein
LQSVAASFASSTVTVSASADQHAALVILPALGSGFADARAINDAGTVIVGMSWDDAGQIHAVKWTQNSNGVWQIIVLPNGATNVARTLNNLGDIAGHTEPSPRSGLVWQSNGGMGSVGCGEAGGSQVVAMSANARVTVGSRLQVTPLAAAAWTVGGCRELLPPLTSGAFSVATAANGDGTQVAGRAGAQVSSTFDEGLPVRWQRSGANWTITALDARAGVANAIRSNGDVVGAITGACGVFVNCQNVIIWSADGAIRELGSFGQERATPFDVNSVGELVGSHSSPAANSQPFIWSDALGPRTLPTLGRGGVAWSMSDVRPDGARYIVGVIYPNEGNVSPGVLWVVRTP